MPFSNFVADPNQLARLSCAFDQGWMTMIVVAPLDQLMQHAERERLGNIVLDLASRP